MSNSQIVKDVVDNVSAQVGKVIFGHQDVSRMLAGAMVIGGHVLLEGPPGIAKTLLAKTFAHTLGLTFKRIQFTPDLMPSDVTGVSVLDRQSSTFRFAQGPIFADILLADEINRTPPKTQSALLEAMEEHVVTVDGQSYPLGEYFFVIATQNPIEHEGTFPLPEAQLDRFLFRILMTYPGQEFEGQMIRTLSSTGSSVGFRTADLSAIARAVSSDELRKAKAALREIVLTPALSDYIVRLVFATRGHPKLILGASPRAALNLALAAKLQAALNGREYAIPDDVKDMIKPVLNHRLILQSDTFDSGGSTMAIIDEILGRTPVPQQVGP